MLLNRLEKEQYIIVDNLFTKKDQRVIKNNLFDPFFPWYLIEQNFLHYQKYQNKKMLKNMLNLFMYFQREIKIYLNILKLLQV
mgnify:CR=1 FL=1